MNQLYALEEKCCGCAACVQICPCSCIEMTRTKNGFQYPSINQNKCIDCKLCTTVCPILNSSVTKSDVNAICFAAKNISDNIRSASTSGGLFSAISDWFIQDSGFVFGAVYDEDMSVCHLGGNSAELRNRQRCSKYIQSNLGNTFLKIGQLLKEGNKVLFTGVPCQCSALRLYMSASNLDVTNLFLCDILCYGVGNPTIWNDYIHFLEQRFRKRVSFCRFRNTWRDTQVTISFQDGTSMPLKETMASFYSLYNKRLVMRSSCFNCPYSSSQRTGDITIGDFWGIEKFMPKFEDSLGVSLLMINTKKGNFLLDQIKEKLVLRETTLNQVCNPEQPHIVRPADKPGNYDQFQKDYREHGLMFVMEKYLNYGWKAKLKAFYWKWDWKIREYLKCFWGKK